MKIEPIREVKARLSQMVAALPSAGSVIITKNGRPCAVLMPVTEDTDLEIIALSQNRRFWNLFDRAIERGDAGAWTPLSEA